MCYSSSLLMLLYDVPICETVVPNEVSGVPVLCDHIVIQLWVSNCVYFAASV